MPYVRLLVHLVWGTRDHQPLLQPALREPLFAFLQEYARQKQIRLLHLNGQADHVHALVALQAQQTIAAVVQLLKGGSAYWVNKQLAPDPKLSWQDEYFAVSVSQSDLLRVQDYIDRQHLLHEHKTFEEEYQEFLRRFPFEEALPGTG